MSQTERQKRLRVLIKKLNKQRKQQASKIDILCNDMVSAHRAFLHRLQDIGFVAEFCRSLLGSTDLNHLLARAGRAIRQELPGTGVSFFLRQPDGCEIHAIEKDEALYQGHQGPEDCLDAELVDCICRSNRPCVREDLLGMGLETDSEIPAKFSLATLPIADLGRSLGFVLIWRPRPQVVTAEELRRVNQVMCGLARAIHGARVPLPSEE